MKMSKNKSKGNKKKTIIVCSVVVLLLLGGLGIGGYFYYHSKGLKVNLKKNITVNIFDEFYNIDGVKKIKNGTLISKKEKVDTSTLGDKTISLSIKDYFKKTKKYSYTIRVVDKEAPVINGSTKLSVEEGGEIDLLKDITVTDNSKEEIKATVEGEYDLKTPGVYSLNYVAKDSSGNETKTPFELEVTKKVVVPAPKKYYAPSPSPTAADGTFTTSNGHKGVIQGGVTYIDGVLIANKTYNLPSTYNPGGLTGEMYSALQAMFNAASSEGINLWIKSGFRSYQNQQNVYAGWVSRYGQATADTISARPGHSEHQSGLAADINSLDQSFEYTPEGKWLNSHCAQYGFIIRYVKGKEHETGYAFEPWHVRYVGTDLATKLYNNGNWITMESYFGITSKYQ